MRPGLAVVIAVLLTGNSPQAQESTTLVVGQVVDATDNRPVPGALVTITSSRDGMAVTVVTESRGRFVFRGLLPATYGITASKPGWIDGAYGRRRPKGAPQSLQLADGQRIGSIVIPLFRRGVISGTVRDEFGDPIVGVEVRALLKTFRNGEGRWIAESIWRTDDRGAFRLSGLSPGEYAVVIPSTNTTDAADAAGERGLRTDIPVSVGQERGAPYVYRTTFYPAALTSSEARPISIAPGQEQPGIDFELSPVPTVTVSGTLTGGTQGTRYSIELMRAVEGPSGRVTSVSDIRVASSTSEADGRFTLPAVPTGGQYILRASGSAAPGPNTASPSAKVPVTVGQADVANLVVPLGPGAVVSGRLEFVGSLAAPPPARLPQIPVTAEVLDPRDGASKVGQTTADGRFTIRGIPSSDYLIMVPGAPQGWFLESVTVEGRDVTDRAIAISEDLSEVVLRFTDQPTQLSGHVIGASGPDTAASVVVFPRGGASPNEVGWANGSRRFQIIRVDRTGAYLFGRLPAGDYYVAALPDEDTANWMDAEFQLRLSARATAVQLRTGDKATLDLRTLVGAK